MTDTAGVRLVDFLAVRSILMQSSIEDIAASSGIDPSEIAEWLGTVDIAEDSAVPAWMAESGAIFDCFVTVLRLIRAYFDQAARTSRRSM